MKLSDVSSAADLGFEGFAVLTSRFCVLTGDLSVELPLRPAAHRADLLQAAMMEEAAPDGDQQESVISSTQTLKLWTITP